LDQTASGPDESPDLPSQQPTGTEGSPWKRVALAVLGLLAVAFIVALLILPLPMFQQPPTAEAVKHPPFPKGKACDAVGCHDDYTHKQPYNKGTCDTCHVTSSWGFVRYTHSYTEMNRGIHPVLGCESCHDYGSPPPNKACQTCHKAKSPHRGLAYANCSFCHQAIGWQFLKVPPGHLSLAGGHEGLDCTACHNPISFKAPGRDCSNCHGNKHGFTSGCAKCHDPARFWYVNPNSINHSFFPFGKAHAKVACRKCHPALMFVGTSPECASCHGANHGFNSGCTRCHSVFIGGWKIKHFNHDFYPLSGVHASFDCGACHPSRTYSLPNPNQEKGGYLPARPHIQFVGVQPSCQKCHGSPHGSCLSTVCYDCHNTSSTHRLP